MKFIQEYFDIQEEFVSYLRTLNEKDWQVMVTEKWSVKDIVSIMVGWEKDDIETLSHSWRTKQAPWYMETEEYEFFNGRSINYYRA